MILTHFIGIDVSKPQLDVALSDQTLFSVPNSAKGFQSLLKRLRKLAVESITLESTGIYSSGVATFLTESGYLVHLVQPGRIRSFAKSQGILAKTDTIDARVIALYGKKTEHLQPYVIPTAEERRLRALVDRRDQINEDLVRERNRKEGCEFPEMIRQINLHIRMLTKELGRMDVLIKEHIRSSAVFLAKSKKMQEETGVGLQTAAVLLGHLPELGRINRQEIAAVAGLAPYNNDSGPHKGKRTIYGGRHRVRTALYMAAMSASNHHHLLKEYYQKMLRRGKLKKVALIAVARKLLIRLNSMVGELLIAEHN